MKERNQETTSNNMVNNIRFISLVLGLLFVLNALKDYSCAHAHLHDWGMDKDKPVAPSKKELVENGFTTTRKIGVGGRKMVVHQEEVIKGRKGSGGEHSSKDISGLEQNNALVKSLQVSQDQYLNHQRNMDKLKKKREKFAGSLGSPRRSTSKPKAEAVNLQETKPTAAKHSNQESKKWKTKTSFQMKRSEKNKETQTLIEATKEIVNLMNKDYKGMDRPRRKPPINNHIPIH